MTKLPSKTLRYWMTPDGKTPAVSVSPKSIRAVCPGPKRRIEEAGDLIRAAGSMLSVAKGRTGGRGP